MAYKFNPFTGNLDEVGAGSGGEVELNLGSEGSPSLFFNGDTNTGLYSPGADQVAISTNGTGRLFVDASGSVSIGDTWANNANPVVYITKNSDVGSIVLKGNGGTSNALAVYNGGWSGSNQVFSVRGDGSVWGRTDLVLGTGSSFTERLRIDSSGRLLVGTSTTDSNFNSGIQIAGIGGSNAGSQLISRFSADAASPTLWFQKSRGASVGTNTIVNNGDDLGLIGFYGASGSTVNEAARITAQVDGTPGANDMPGRLVFSTTADGAAAPTERMRIDSYGSVLINTGSNPFGFAGTIIAPDIYSTHTTAAGANLHIASQGIFYRSTSSIKYKTDVETMQDSYADAILNSRPVWYRSTCTADNSEWGYWGFIAEEIAEIDPRLVHWKTHEAEKDEEDNDIQVELDQPIAEGVQYERFVPHLLNLIKRQKDQIEAMEARLSALEAS